MIRTYALPIGLVLGFAIAAGSTALAQSLRDVPVVTEGLITAAIAWEIGDKCDDLDARLLRGVAFLNGLKDHARGLGYSNADIDAFVDDKAEKDRLESEARARLTAMGAVPGDAASFCAVGNAEIAAGSAIGRLLR